MTKVNSRTDRRSIKPPVTSVGVIGWIKGNLFNGWFNSSLTIVTLYFLWKIVPPFIRWAFIDSLWTSTGAECHEAGGACWSIIPANIRFILFGFFPYESQWRPLVAMISIGGSSLLQPEPKSLEKVPGLCLDHRSFYHGSVDERRTVRPDIGRKRPNGEDCHSHFFFLFSD